MNNREKSSLDIVSTDSVVLETTPVIEVEPEAIEITHGRSFSVLIKHDYYSSESSHGRDLLNAFLCALQSRKADIAGIFVVDSGVRMLSDSNSLHNDLKDLCGDVAVVTVCLDSLEEYGLELSDLPSNFETMDAISFAGAVINIPNLIILE